MLRINGSLWRSRSWIGKVPFNAVTDVKFSDSSASTGGGAQVINDTTSGLTYQIDDLIGATIYLLFLDGVQFTQVSVIGDLDANKKQFYLNSTSGTVTFSYTIADPVDITIFYISPGTAALPAVEPVTLAEAKAYMKIDTGTTDDDLIEELLITAREQCEDYAGLSIVNRTVTAVLNNSCGGIYLPYGPVISITSITDQDDEDPLDTDNYEVRGLDFPQLIDPVSDKVTLIYTAGYGIPPKRIKTAILQQVFFLYENRGEAPMIYRGVEAAITMSPQALATLQRLRRV